MPAVSKKQKKFMQAVANNPKFAKKVGVPTKVGKEFTKETKMKKYRSGGMPSMKELEDTAAEIGRRDMSAKRKLRLAEPMARGRGGEDIGAERAALRGLRDMVASPGEAMARAAEGTRRAMEKAGLSPVRGTMPPMMQRQERPPGMKKGGAEIQIQI
jgi:hypothetical protein